MKKWWFQKIWRMGLLLLALVALSCAAPPKKPTEPQLPIEQVPIEKDPFSVFLEECRDKAVAYEKSGELFKALQSWQIVASFTPTDEEVAKRIVFLETQMVNIADQHFKQGLSLFQRRSLEAARKEFLIALYYNPANKEALDYLKHKLPGEDYILYRAKGGETLKEIARKTFNDPNKDFLIAYFNDLRIDSKLAPGNTLRIPILESSKAKVEADTKERPMSTKETGMDAKEISTETEQMLSKASAYYKARNYKEAVSASEKVLDYDPANKQARHLITESYYQTGKLLIQGKKYQQALEAFNRVDSGYKDVKESIAFLKKQLAGDHYVRGVKYFTDEELDKAIREWELTLALDPNHPKAKKDIDNARTLLEKLKEIK